MTWPGDFEEDLQAASVDDFGIPVPAVMEKIIDRFAPPEEDQYEHIELIVKARPDGESWFDVIHDYLTQDCDSVRLEDDEEGFEQWSPCHCGMEHMSGMGGTLKQCYNHTTDLGGGIQPIDVARAIISLTNRSFNSLGTHEEQLEAKNVIRIIKWAHGEIEFEEYFDSKKNSDE